MEENIRNYTDEVVIKMVGKLTLRFEEFKNLETQRELKSILEESLYGYNVMLQEKSLLVSDIEEKINYYICSRRIEGLSKSTLYNYDLILRKFSDCFTKPINSITSDDIRMYLLMNQQNGCSQSTLNSKIFCLNKFFAYLLDNEMIVKNPMNKIKSVKIPKRLKRVMTNDHLEMLKDSCESIREEAIINFAITTGSRVSEICDSNYSMINWEEQSIYIIGKGDKERKVYFDTKTKILLQKYMKTRKEFEEHDSLFICEKFPYKRISTRGVQCILEKIKRRANLDDVEFITMHGFRRKFATNKIRRGMRLEHIQMLLGHSNPSVTLRYAQISDEDVKYAYNTTV